VEEEGEEEEDLGVVDSGVEGEGGKALAVG
jgi:hypothetical protein